MDDAVPDLGFGGGSMDGCVKYSQIVPTGNENSLYLPVAQTVEHGGPELSVLIFTAPHA